jgi:hypothetical protein
MPRCVASRVATIRSGQRSSSSYIGQRSEANAITRELANSLLDDNLTPIRVHRRPYVDCQIGFLNQCSQAPWDHWVPVFAGIGYRRASRFDHPATRTERSLRIVRNRAHPFGRYHSNHANVRSTSARNTATPSTFIAGDQLTASGITRAATVELTSVRSWTFKSPSANPSIPGRYHSTLVLANSHPKAIHRKLANDIGQVVNLYRIGTPCQLARGFDVTVQVHIGNRGNRPQVCEPTAKDPLPVAQRPTLESGPLQLD